MWTLFKKDLLRLKKQPTGFLVLIVIPLAATAIMGFIFTNNGKESLTPHIKLVIEDHDDSMLTRMIISAFAQKELKKYFDVEEVGKGKGRAFIEEDKASALVVIPEGFTEAFFDAKPTEFRIIKNPSQAFGPKIVEEIFKIFALGGDRIVRIAEAPLKAIKAEIDKDDFSADQVIAKIAVMINQILRKTIPVIEDSPITIKSRTESDDKPEPDNNALLIIILSGISTMCVYFFVENLGIDYFRERENFTLRRILVSPASATAYVLSKQLYLVIAGFMSLITVWVLAFAIWGIHIKLSQIFPFLIMLLLIALSSEGIISFMYTLVRTRSQASVLSPVIIILGLIGGGIVPTLIFPEFIKSLSILSPIYWSANGLQKILINGSSLGMIFKNVAILGLFSICCIGGSILIQRRREM